MRFDQAVYLLSRTMRLTLSPNAGCFWVPLIVIGITAPAPSLENSESTAAIELDQRTWHIKRQILESDRSVTQEELPMKVGHKTSTINDGVRNPLPFVADAIDFFLNIKFF